MTTLGVAFKNDLGLLHVEGNNAQVGTMIHLLMEKNLSKSSKDTIHEKYVPLLDILRLDT